MCALVVVLVQDPRMTSIFRDGGGKFEKGPVFLPYQVSFHESSHPRQSILCIMQEQFQQLLSSVHEYPNHSENGI